LIAGSVQYGLSLLSGLATFAGLKILQHTTASDDAFSRLSLIVLSFTTFQLIADLGTQTEFLRSWHHVEPARRHALCHVLIHSRLTLALVVMLVAGVYCVTSGFSEHMSLSFLLYQLAFIPFAFISSVDSIFFARREFTKAVLVRVSRLVALATFLVAAAWVPAKQEFLVPLASTLTFGAMALFAWRLVLRKMMTPNSKTKIQLFSSSGWRNLGPDAKLFLKGSSIAAIIIGIISAHGLLAHSILVRHLGESSLTQLNTSLALATPGVLAFQTLVQLVSPNIASWTRLNRKQVALQFTTFFSRLSLVFVVMSVGLWGANALGLVSWFFPLANTQVLPMCLFLLAAQWAMNLAAPAIVACQYLRRHKVLVVLLLVSAIVACAVQIWWIRLLHEHAYLMSLFIMGAVSALGAIILSLRALPTSSASS
jgi:O-antigen/teichoic acid export membrane protein